RRAGGTRASASRAPTAAYAIASRLRLPRASPRCSEGREGEKAEEIDPVATDLHARDQRDDGHDCNGDEPSDGRGGCVAEDDSASPRCRQEKAAHEAALEVARNPEAGKDPREGRRLQQHEDELERGIAGGKVESRYVANS